MPEKPKTVESLFDDLLGKIKKSKDVVGNIEELKENVIELFKEQAFTPSPDNKIIVEIAWAINQILIKSGDLELSEKFESLHKKLTESHWKDRTDLII